MVCSLSVLFNFCVHFLLGVPEEKFPNITQRPKIQVQAGHQETVVFRCIFQFTSKYPIKARFFVTWYRPVTFFGGKFGRISISSETVRRSPSTYAVRVGDDIPLGATVRQFTVITLIVLNQHE